MNLSLATFGIENDNDDLLEEVEPKKKAEKSEMNLSLSTFGVENNNNLLEEVETKKKAEKSSSSKGTKKLESASSSKSVGATDKKAILKLLAFNANAFNSFMKGQQQLIMRLDD